MTRGRAPLAVAILAGLLVCSGSGIAPAAEAPLLSRAEVKQRWMGRLDGRHFGAAVRLRIRRGNAAEERRIRVWRDDKGSRRERLMALFDAPADLRGVGFIYLENQDRPNDYFMYQPSLRRVRRIAENVARQDVYGVDLEYLGFGVAQMEPTELKDLSLDPDTVVGGTTFRVTEKALQFNQRFDERTVWLDPETFVPMRTEHRRQGRVTLIGRTEEVAVIQGVATPIRTSFERPLDRELVSMIVERIDYEAPIPEHFFTTLNLLKRR